MRRFQIENVLITAVVATVVSALVSIGIKYIYPVEPLILQALTDLDGMRPYSGRYCIRWDFQVQPARKWIFGKHEAWASLNFEILEPDNPELFDLSNIEALQFHIYGDRKFGEIDEFNVFVERIRLQYYNLNINYSTDWEECTIRLPEDLQLTPWHERAKREYLLPISIIPDMKSVYAFGFTVKSHGGLKRGIIYIDPIKLIDKSGREWPFEDFEKPLTNPREIKIGENIVIRGKWVIRTGSR
jgi:hypothetical protein